MTTSDQKSRGAAITIADKIGKVFVVVGDMRQCLICDQAITRQGAAEHANVDCTPESLRQPHLPYQLSKPWVGTQGVE